jgi:hypothetical protein
MHVVNVIAGSGSYESVAFDVTSGEPSLLIRAA